MYRSFLKRAIDIIVSLTAIIVLSVPMAVIAIAVKLTSRGPAFFKQKRLGKGGKVFNMYKFRSMVVGAEAGGVYSDSKDSRITKVGNFLRKTSIDELPQFVNIIKGDMSFIGFRPPLTYHPWPFEEYTEEQKKMFIVRPGISGWAQVNGRKTVEWHKRIELNVWYAENVSLWLDIKIAFMTVLKVLKNSDNENVGASLAEDKKSEAESKPALSESEEN